MLPLLQDDQGGYLRVLGASDILLIYSKSSGHGFGPWVWPYECGLCVRRCGLVGCFATGINVCINKSCTWLHVC